MKGRKKEIFNFARSCAANLWFFVLNHLSNCLAVPNYISSSYFNNAMHISETRRKWGKFKSFPALHNFRSVSAHSCSMYVQQHEKCANISSFPASVALIQQCHGLCGKVMGMEILNWKMLMNEFSFWRALYSTLICDYQCSLLFHFDDQCSRFSSFRNCRLPYAYIYARCSSSISQIKWWIVNWNYSRDFFVPFFICMQTILCGINDVGQFSVLCCWPLI